MIKERGRNPVLERIRSEYQCLQKWGQYSNVRKDKVRIPMLGGIPMFKTRDRILVLGRIKSEYQSLQKQGQSSNVSKDKIKVPMCTKIQAVFYC